MKTTLEQRIRCVIRSCRAGEHFIACRNWIDDLQRRKQIDLTTARLLLSFADGVEANATIPAQAPLFAHAFRVPEHAAVL